MIIVCGTLSLSVMMRVGLLPALEATPSSRQRPVIVRPEIGACVRNVTKPCPSRVFVFDATFENNLGVGAGRWRDIRPCRVCSWIWNSPVDCCICLLVTMKIAQVRGSTKPSIDQSNLTQCLCHRVFHEKGYGCNMCMLVLSKRAVRLLWSCE